MRTRILATLHEDFDYIGYFVDGLAYVQKNGKHNTLDTAGNLLFPRWYPMIGKGRGNNVCNYSEGMLSLVNESGKFGYADTSGKIVLPFRYDYAGYFEDGLACVQAEGKYGLIDKSGAFVVPPAYDMLGISPSGVTFREDKLIALKDGKCGFINRAGETVIPFIFDKPARSAKELLVISEFGEGSAPVRLDGKGIFIDANGQPILPIPEGCSSAGTFYQGLSYITFPCETGGYTCRILRRDGSWLLPAEYDTWGLIRCGRILVKRGERLMYIDVQGNIVIDTDYEFANDFFSGQAWVKKDGKWGTIDTDGNVIAPITLAFDKLSPQNDGSAVVCRDGKYGLIGPRGEEIIPTEYDNSPFVHDGYTALKKDGTWTIVQYDIQD